MTARRTLGKARWRPAIGGLLSGFVLLAVPSAAGAGVAITVPATVDLGTAPTGAGTLSAQMGEVTVTATGILGLSTNFTATVSSTDFTTGGKTAAETIVKASISYWSGPLTASSGSSQTAVPGQLTAAQRVSLSEPRIAFSSSGGLLSSFTTSWNPTIVVTVPAAVIAGPYTGTITHSVA